MSAAFVKRIEVQELRLAYDSKEVLHGISFDVYQNEIFAVIGPAQSGKSSMLRCLNRTIDFTANAKMSGKVLVDGEDVRRTRDIYALRRKIGMVAPLPVGLPLTIYDNVAFAPRSAGLSHKTDLDAIVERCLRQAALWDEVKDRLTSLGTALSGGQQQRLTIARALSHQPEILCLDEFSIAIDPVTTMRIEDVLKELRREITILLVTNLTQQARRLSDRTMFLWDGEIVEIDLTDVIFSGAAEEPAHPGLRERGVRMSDAPTAHAIETRRLSLWYGSFQALKEVSVSLREGIITSLIGPSGCGKTTLLALLQPRQRALRQRPHLGRDPHPRREHLRARRSR